jgi:hypothetical protein
MPGNGPLLLIAQREEMMSAPKTQPAGKPDSWERDELQRVIEEYANELRAMIKNLRKLLN